MQAFGRDPHGDAGLLDAWDADVAAIALWAAANDDHGANSTASGSTAMDDDDEYDDDDEPVGPSDSASSSDTSATRETATRKRGKTEEPAPRARRPRKPRKSTYLIQKEQKSSLTDEIRLLEARLELLKVKAGLPTNEDKRSITDVQTTNFEMEEAIHANLLGVARLHSMLSRHMQSLPVGPITTAIHLPRDLTERRAMLLAIRDMKLRRAQELLEHRNQHVDITKPYETEERIYGADGVYMCKRFEVLPFENARDVQQVFDALLMFLGNMGSTLTKRSPTTIREDMDLVDSGVWHRRIISQISPRYPFEQELHSVGFARFSKTDNTKQPMGIIAADNVDSDELYPYRPHEWVRKDVIASIRVLEEPLPDKPNKRLIVVRRSTVLRIHPTPFALPAVVEEEMRTNIAGWCRAMNAFLRETVAEGR